MNQTLDEVIENLSYGPLSNLAIGNSGDGTIPTTERVKVVQHINAGLTQLYSRFVLYQRELFIRLQEGMSVYPLIPSAGESYVDPDPQNPSVKYILDHENAPFSSDVIRILEAWKTDPNNPDDIIEVGINDPEAPESVYTPAFDIVQIIDGDPGDIYQFMYQAKHYKLLPDLEGQIVYLPYQLYEVLQSYVAYKIFSSMNGEEHRARANDHLTSYSNGIQMTVDVGLPSAVPVGLNSKLEQRGFK